MSKKVAIAMSGGVDSSAAALILQEQGYDCIGITLRLFDKDDSDVRDAKSVAAALGITHHTLVFSNEFQHYVVGSFIRAYEQGNTPNPCIDCNRHIKFGGLYERAREMGCDYIATGHYARIDFDAASNRYLLKKSSDPAKDQSYVLFGMTQELLASTLFPLGNMSKPEVRELLSSHDFTNAHKSESQDICFIPDGDYAGYIARHTGKVYPPGDFVDSSGCLLGRHKGIIRYTIGQRKGLGLALPQPMYVCAIEPETNIVRLGLNDALYERTLFASGFNWIACDRPKVPMRVKAKIRYRQQEEDAFAEQIDNQTVCVTFDKPQRAITPGQAVVLYQDDIVVGGGKIYTRTS